MMYHILVAVVGIVLLSVLWIGVQALVRKQSPGLPEDADVLACTLCDPDGTCHCGIKRSHNRLTSKERNDDFAIQTGP